MYDDWAYGDVLKYDPDQPRAPAGTSEGGQWTDGFMAGSTAVDENGEPLVVYHGTEAQFDAFDERMIGTATDEGWAGRGFYFSSDPTVADAYGSRRVAAHLSLKNPYQFKGNFYEQVQAKGGPAGFSEWLRSEGYDGARLWSQYMVLDASQIRIVDVAKWNEADHPRHPAGNEQGGEFAPKDGGVEERRFKVPEGGPLAGDPEAIRSEEFDRKFATDRALSDAEKSTIDGYIVDGYANINLYLNGHGFGQAEPGKFQSPFFDGEIANMDSAIASSRTVEDIEVWRGFQMPRDLSDEKTGDARLFPGDVITEKGFVSTSLDKGTAANFAALRSTGLLVKIKVPKGTNALHVHMDMSHVYGEHEVILPRNTSLRLLTRPSWQTIRREGSHETKAYVADAELVKGT